jgi:uncharacterized membrane protein (DUF485 family)
MDAQTVGRIRNSAEFQELEARRTSFAWTLTFVMLAIYYAFIFSVAFLPDLMATTIGGTVVTIGFPFGLFVMVAAVVLTGLYVWKANTEYDDMTRQIVANVR